MPKYFTRIVFVLITLIMLRATLSELPEWRGLFSPPAGSDFMGYYIGACLVRTHQSLNLYEEAKRNSDPLLDNADSNTVMARMARAHGLLTISQYDYPPTLADLMVPLTFLSSTAAFFVWSLINLAALLSAGCILVRILGIEPAGHTLLVFVFLVFFRSTSNCLYWGQVSFVLMFLMIAGMSLYLQEKRYSAAGLFALAAAIKLTPLIVIVPLLAWRDWKTLRAFALWTAAIAGALLAINGWGALSLYFLHELPKMSALSIDSDNRSLGVAVEALLHGTFESAQLPVLIWAGRLTCAIVICLAGWQSWLNCEGHLKNRSRIETFTIFILLSCCLSPVAGFYLYVLCAPELVIVAKRTWENKSTVIEAILLPFFILSISTGKFEFFKLMTPVLGTALALIRLRSLRLERRREEVSPETALSVM